MSRRYPASCPVARWAGDGRDYVIAPDVLPSCEVFQGMVMAQSSRLGWLIRADEMFPLNAAARAVLAVARGK